MPQANYCKSCALRHSITTRQSTKENLDIRSCQHYGAELCSQSSLKENLYITDLMETTKLQAYLKHYRIQPLTGEYGSSQAKGMKLCLPTINSRLTLSFQKLEIVVKFQSRYVWVVCWAHPFKKLTQKQPWFVQSTPIWSHSDEVIWVCKDEIKQLASNRHLFYGPPVELVLLAGHCCGYLQIENPMF